MQVCIHASVYDIVCMDAVCVHLRPRVRWPSTWRPSSKPEHATCNLSRQCILSGSQRSLRL